jgi:hypothetical protein
MNMEDQGIMALAPGAQMQGPTAQPAAPLINPAEEAAFEQFRTQADPKEFGDELLNTAAQVDPAAVQQFRQALSAAQLPPEVIDLLGQIVDSVLAEPGRYAEIRAEFLADPEIGDVLTEVLPPEFDAVYFGALNMALDQMSGSMPAAQPVQQFAAGGIVNLKPIAAEMAKMGRNGDSMLAHITRSEARMLRRNGGSGTINPSTGLPEFFFKKIKKAVSSAFKSVKKAISGVIKSVKNFVKSDLGRMVATVALGFFVGPAAAGMLGVSSAAGIAAVSGFVGGAGSTLLAGGSIKDALKAGAIGGVTAGAVSGVMGGASAFQANPNAPTTFMGGLEQQVDKFTGALESLSGTANTPAQVGPSSVSATEGVVTPVTASDAVVTPIAPTPPTPPTPTTGAFDAGQYVPSDMGMVPSAPVTPGIQQATASPTDYLLSETPATAISAPSAPSMFDISTAGQPGSALPPIQGVGGTAVPTSATQAAQPGVLDSLRQGNLIDAGKAAYNNVLDFYGAEPSQEALAAARDKLAATGKPFTATDVIKMAEPTFGTTSRLLATGLGGLYLTGGFEQEPVEPPGIIPSETGEQLLAQDPQKYGVRLGGANTTYAENPYLSQGNAGTPSPMQMPLFNVRDPRSYLDPGLFALAPSGGMQRFADGGQVAAPRTPKFGDIEAIRQGIMAASKVQDMTRFAKSTPVQFRAGNATASPPAPVVDRAPGNYVPSNFRGITSNAILRNIGTPSKPANFVNPTPVAFRPGGAAPAARFAMGGIANLPVQGYNKGGNPKFPRRTGQISGPGTETSDDIPAMLSDGEFVMTAKAVRGAGGGSRREGAKRMYKMMHALERKA